MNQYDIFKEKRQEEYNKLPMKAAFGTEQFKTMMQEWNLCHGKDGNPTDNDKKQIVHICGGVYMKKTDIHLLKELSDRYSKEMENAIAADTTGDGFIYDMFYSELCNHEYGYTLDPDDAIMALGFTIEEVTDNPVLLHGLNKAETAIRGW